MILLIYMLSQTLFIKCQINLDSLSVKLDLVILYDLHYMYKNCN